MIQDVEGDILDAEVDALVNPVNCVGVMGAGLAKRFKDAYPTNYLIYRDACRNGLVTPGRVLSWKHPVKDLRIFNFPTKLDWRDPSQPEYIERGLASLVFTVEELDIRSIAIPQLGCGLGGLDWSDVRPMIVAAFDRVPSAFDVRVLLYTPEKIMVGSR